MATYTITLSDAQDKALQHVVADAQWWIQNAINVRSNAAIEEIVNAEVQRKLAAGEPITGNKDDIVLAANIKTAAEMSAEQEAFLALGKDPQPAT